MELVRENSEMNFVKERYRSEFFNELLDSEYLDITKDEIFIKNHMHINLAYISGNDNELELGVYITNNSDVEVNIRKLPIALYEKNLKKCENIVSIMKKIPSKEAIFHTVIIPNRINLKEINSQEFKVDFGDLNMIAQYPWIDISVNNIPKIGGYKRHREMKKFLKNLPLIKENQLRIDIFKTGEVEEGFCIISLFRNSSNKDININSIPLTVYAEINYPVYKGVYNINDDGLIIEANKGKFYSVVIPFESFPKVDNHDLSKYIVEFK